MLQGLLKYLKIIMYQDFYQNNRNIYIATGIKNFTMRQIILNGNLKKAVNSMAHGIYSDRQFEYNPCKSTCPTTQ